MKYSTNFKVIMSICIFLGIGFLTGFLLLITLLNGDGEYVPFIVVSSMTVYLLIVYSVFGLFKIVKSKNGFIISVGTLWLIAGGNFAFYMYHENMDSVSAEVDLEQYEPNKDGTKVVTLEKQASLQLPKENLLRLDGATALYPLYSSFVQATYPKQEYKLYDSVIKSTKSDQAFKNLIIGNTDIIFVASLSEAQLKYAENKGVKLDMTPIGREAFVFFVHSNNSIEGLSSNQIREIYSGKITNWKEVGGQDDVIRAFQRPADSGSQTAIERFMGTQTLMEAPTQDIELGMGGVINQVAEYKNYRNALGYTFRFYSTGMVRNDNIRLFKVDGVYPDIKSNRSETYPITAEFYAITAGTTNPHAQAFINWILSEEGQELIEKTGYVPIE
ncbi:PstS family phosphate ABC transporter substrate-binding protein [Paenisporosarcina sp. TG20]|uniref:PstS family phosphate ABC transporter substrate-binding protein n=1 Tax=Paenisporosarcina sp. TG20 TaxID=1211706 RepID=UPI00030E543F|nr:substrate-binding domain-containing protein [Paenisporosarcina sp. TG20]